MDYHWTIPTLMKFVRFPKVMAEITNQTAPADVVSSPQKFSTPGRRLSTSQLGTVGSSHKLSIAISGPKNPVTHRKLIVLGTHIVPIRCKQNPYDICAPPHLILVHALILKSD